jgi:hypothetical protein
MSPEIAAVIKEAGKTLSAAERRQAERLYREGCCTLLSQSPLTVEFAVDAPGALSAGDNPAPSAPAASNIPNTGGGEKGPKTGPETAESIFCTLCLDEGGKTISPLINGKKAAWNRRSYACLLRYEEELADPASKTVSDKRFTREGMIRRVLDERRDRADKADYRVQWADNIYGDHILTNEKGSRYTVFLRDFERETGYSDSADAAYNKLGTTKHIMYAFAKLKENKSLYAKLDKTFPFIEIYCDPLNEYKISWYYPVKPAAAGLPAIGLPAAEQELIARFFKTKPFLEESKVKSFLKFIEAAESFDTIRVRPEVREKVERYYEDLMLEDLRKNAKPDFSRIKAELFSYQVEGINFALFRRAAIIADEMGLGKTVQAVGTAVLKKQIFAFSKTLVIYPATLKSQWKAGQPGHEPGGFRSAYPGRGPEDQELRNQNRLRGKAP